MSFSDKQRTALGEEIDQNITRLVSRKSESSHPKIHAVVAGVTNDRESIYLSAKGVQNVNDGTPVTPDSVMAYFSCTKPITALAVLQLYEQGKIELDKPAKHYIPIIDQIKLIDPGSVDKETGDFTIDPRRSKTEITIKHLLSHTAGFAYAFTNDDYLTLSKKDPHINTIYPTMEFFSTSKMPLVHEPGTSWCYGHSMDWLGLIIQEVTGKKLGDYLKENLFDPVGMSSCTFHVKDTSNLIRVHKKRRGTLSFLRSEAVALDPDMDMGGQGCFGSVRDYLKFLRIWLGKGYSVDGNVRILKEETVAFATQNHLPPGVRITFGEEIDALLPEGFEPDGFTLAGCAYSMNEFPTGRPKGAIYWSGLANLYFWLDLENNVAGFWGTQILPKADPQCLQSYFQLESCVYDALEESKEELNAPAGAKL